MGRPCSLKITPLHGGSGPLSNVWFPRPTRVHNANGILIGSVVFAGLTEHATVSVTVGHICIRSIVMRPNNVPPFPQIDIIGDVVIVWRVRGKTIRSVLCNIVCNNCAQCDAHTYELTNSSLDWVLSHWAHFTVLDSFLYCVLLCDVCMIA